MTLSRTTSRRELDVAKIVGRYQMLRQLGIRIGSTLVKRLSKEVIEEGASKLGMLVGNTIVFESEDMSSVLMDYCIYHVYRNGRNAIEDHLISSPPELGTDEHLWLQAMQHSRYCLIRFENIVPGAGAWIQLLGSQESCFLADMGLAATASPDWILATRLLFFENFCCTGGAGLPVGAAHSRRTKAIVKRATSLLKQRNPDPAPIIEQLLRSEDVARVSYR